MHKFFEIINLQVPCAFVLNDGTRICLQTGIPNSAYEVYKKGFNYLGLLPGAEELFKKESTAVIVELISKATRVQDVEVLALAKKNKAVASAAEKRIEFLTNL